MIKLDWFPNLTLNDVLQRKSTVNDLLPHYPLLNDSPQVNLLLLIRSLRSIDHPDDLFAKCFSKIFTEEERRCCNLNGENGKLVYPPPKRILLERILQLVLHDRNSTMSNDELRENFLRCEVPTATRNSSSNGNQHQLTFDQISTKDEKHWISTLFRQLLSADEIKRIVRAKSELKFPWNTNEICIYHARPLHLHWIKEKWYEQYPQHHANEAERWLECLDWAVESLTQSTKVRPSKRKTSEPMVEQKRGKATNNFQERCQRIDHTKYNVMQYASELLQCLSDVNEQHLPTIEQLKYLERLIHRYYWSANPRQTWSDVLDLIDRLFNRRASDEDFRQMYSKILCDGKTSSAEEIQRLLLLN